MTGPGYRLIVVPDVLLPDGTVRRGTPRMSARQRFQEMYYIIWNEAKSVVQGAAAEGRRVTGPEQVKYDALLARAWELSLKIQAMS